MSIEGQVVEGKYKVVKLLGQGGMGAVYLAEHLVIGRRVALKVLLGSVSGNETAVARFEREAQAAGRIGNDHILEVFDFGSLPDGARYMVCEFLEGETLASRIERLGRLTPAALVPIVRQLLSGLEAAHRAGVVHRDLKPENIFILKQKAGLADFVKIIDFGISKFQPMSTGEGMQMTATGIVVGTPCYLSPEQARGSREADARSDLYAVGVILYECLTGRLPFDAQNVNDLLFKIVLEAPVPLREVAPDVDPGFIQLVEIAMARDPDSRFQSASSFLAAIDSWASEHGIATSARASAINAAIDGSVPAKSTDVKVASGATRSLAPTPGTWADSHVSVAAFQPRRRRPVVFALVGAAVVLVAGLGFAFLRGDGASTAGVPSATASVGANTSAAGSAVPAAPTNEPAQDLVVPTSTPELAVPKVSDDDVKALLEPVAPGAQAPIRPRPIALGGMGGKKGGKTPVASTKKVDDTPPPPPPPPQQQPTATSSKHHHDFGY